MDEKLAKGFSKQFYSWFIEDYEKIIDKVYTDNKLFMERNVHKNKFKKWALKRQSLLKNFNICFLLGGSSNHPYLLEQSYLLLKGEDPNENPRGFDEYHLYPAISLTSFSERYLSDSEREQKQILLEDGNYIISQHAIQRIYQRTDYFDKEKTINHYAIIKELEYIPVWASYWYILCNIDYYEELENIKNFIIPAPNGIFLGKFIKKPNDTRSILHLNTFYGLRELSDIQKNIRDELILIQNGFENSHLSFFNHGLTRSDLYLDIFNPCITVFTTMNYRLNKFLKANKTSEKLNEMGMDAEYLNKKFSPAYKKIIYECDQNFKKNRDYKEFIKVWLKQEKELI